MMSAAAVLLVLMYGDVDDDVCCRLMMSVACLLSGTWRCAAWACPNRK
jgi:hypothetical protein